MYEEELDILLKNMDIRGHQLYINVTEDFKYREFYLQWNMTRFIRLNYVEFNEGLVVRSNNRIISL